MELKWQSFLSLKAVVIAVFLIIWNGSFLYIMYLGGGGLEGVLSPIGMSATGYLCAAASIFSLSVALIKPFQKVVIAPRRVHNFRVNEFYFLAFVTGVLAVSRFTFPVIGVADGAF